MSGRTLQPLYPGTARCSWGLNSARPPSRLWRGRAGLSRVQELLEPWLSEGSRCTKTAAWRQPCRREGCGEGPRPPPGSGPQPRSSGAASALLGPAWGWQVELSLRRHLLCAGCHQSLPKDLPGRCCCPLPQVGKPRWGEGPSDRRLRKRKGQRQARWSDPKRGGAAVGMCETDSLIYPHSIHPSAHQSIHSPTPPPIHSPPIHPPITGLGADFPPRISLVYPRPC